MQTRRRRLQPAPKLGGDAQVAAPNSRGDKTRRATSPACHRLREPRVAPPSPPSPAPRWVLLPLSPRVTPEPRCHLKSLPVLIIPVLLRPHRRAPASAQPAPPAAAMWPNPHFGQWPHNPRRLRGVKHRPALTASSQRLPHTANRALGDTAAPSGPSGSRGPSGEPPGGKNCPSRRSLPTLRVLRIE